MTPELEFVFELNAQLAGPVDIGATPCGVRRIVDIFSGTFSGPQLKGTLRPGGSDWQIIRPDDVTELHAHYILRTEDGVLIQVKVRGLRHATGDALERIAAGQPVNRSEYYFCVAPIFSAPAGQYEWLNRSVFVGSGERRADSVRIVMYRVF